MYNWFTLLSTVHSKLIQHCTSTILKFKKNKKKEKKTGL